MSLTFKKDYVSKQVGEFLGTISSVFVNESDSIFGIEQNHSTASALKMSGYIGLALCVSIALYNRWNWERIKNDKGLFADILHLCLTFLFPLVFLSLEIYALCKANDDKYDDIQKIIAIVISVQFIFDLFFVVLYVTSSIKYI